MMSPFHIIEPAWSRRRRWVVAGLFAAALHFGGAAAMLQWPQLESEENELEGALLLEMAPIAVASPDQTQNLAIGAPSEDSVATPATEEVKETQTKDDLPQIEDAPLAPEPEVVLEKVKPVELKELPEEKPVQEAQPEMVASIAAAPPPIEATEVAEKSAAPTQGSSRKPNAAELSWQKAIFLHVAKFKRYPADARNRHIEGVATVRFSIDDGGNVTNVHIFKGSGSTLLDVEAMEILRRASPLPVPPKDQASRLAAVGARTLALPIQFSIR